MAKKAEPKKPAAAKPKAVAAVKPAPAKTAATKATPVKAASKPAAKPKVAPVAAKAAQAPAKAKPIAVQPATAQPVATAPKPAVAAPVAVVDGVRRRDFINIAAVSFAGAGAVAIVVPLINQMNPSADVLAEASTEVDVSQIQPGQSIKTVFRKQPLFVRHLTSDEVALVDKVDSGSLRDPQTLEERTQPGKSQWVVMMGVCTHLGCVPSGAAAGEVKGDFHGFFCPCHGSHYDAAGRIRKGPAPANLQVPDYAFISDTVIKVG